MKSRTLAITVLVASLVLGACGGASSDNATPPTGPRPASTAKLEILEPTSGSTFPGGAVTIRLDLHGARIVEEATKELKPDEGHIHLLLNNKLQSMTYGLEQQIQAPPGVHLLLAEFVAGDHAPFNPRVVATRTFEVPATP